MYQVQLTNFGTYFPNRFDTFEQAIEFAKLKGFEATIHDLDYKRGGVAGLWSPIRGVEDWRN